MRSALLVGTCLAVGLAASAFGGITSGLVHHWNFDEGPDWHDSAFGSVCTNTLAADVVGQANGLPRHMGTTNWISGRQYTALEFDGVRQYLEVSTNLAASLGGTASLSFWLLTTQTGGSSPVNSPGVAGTAGNGGVQWGWLDVQGRVSLSVDNLPAAASMGPINDGRWHHIVITRDSVTGASQVFVDGVVSSSAAGPSGVRESHFSSLGRIEGVAGLGYFGGRLDQVYVFNRILASEEVGVLYSNHAPKTWGATTEGVNNRPFSTASVSAKTYDVERDSVQVWRWSQPLHGSVTHNGDGSFTYVAADAHVGADSFNVTVEDGRGGFYTATMTVILMSEPPGGGGVPVTAFTDTTRLQAGGAAITFSGIRVPRAIDWNADGKTDLVVGAGGGVWIYTNTGTKMMPSFAPGVRVKAAGVNVSSGDNEAPIALADITGDGVRDLVVCDAGRKLRVYRNTAGADATPVYAGATVLKHANGNDFVCPDRRFDLGDWNGDGLPDLVTGTFSGAVQLFLNLGTAESPRFGEASTLLSGSYQLYPRLIDLNGNGLIDLLRGINWGDVAYWRDSGRRGLGSSMTLSITGPNASPVDLHSLTDGPVVDFGDFDNDGTFDLVMGGQGGSGGLFLAHGVQKTIAKSLEEIEAIYDANSPTLGVALSANTNALLNQVNAANWNLISYLQNGTLGTREALYSALSNHVAKYWFLKYRTLDTNSFHHVPSIALQNWVMLASSLPDTPTRRTNIADVMGLTGTMRTLFLESGLALGDNAKSIPPAYSTIRDFRLRHPRELFPDAVLTIDQLYGDGRGGFIWTPNSTKNTFGDWAVGPANEWAGDLTSAIEKALGPGAASGDYFTFVAGHEITHSLDGYVNSRANTDLRKRWGLTLCLAAGPDVMAGQNGWWDLAATKTNFKAKGYWDGVEANWKAAWSNYWAAGAGAAFRNTSFMRGNIDWFLDAPQESLATQANHYWANAPGRLVGAVDRFRRAGSPGLAPLRANINEVVTFIDFQSAGMNRVNLVETKYQASPRQVNWIDHYADLERDDRGYIQRISVEGRSYRFQADTNGVVTNVITSLPSPGNDRCWTFRDTPRRFRVLANDSRLEGGPVQISGVSQPVHGTATVDTHGAVLYSPTKGYSGYDRFTYSVTSSEGGSGSAKVDVEVVDSTAASAPLLVEYWHAIGGGSAVADLTGHSRFPGNPTLRYYTNSSFELRANYGDGYGSRTRAQFVAPASGNYTFWIASDDSSELWLSADGDASSSSLVASVSGWTNPRAWAQSASQRSSPIPLAAGQTIYLEALHKEGNGGDHLSVGWSGPPPYQATNVLAAARLRPPFAGFTPPRFVGHPLPMPAAIPHQDYVASLTEAVVDTNANETLEFTKLRGPEWLKVSASGVVSGVPVAQDVGLNSLMVSVTDSAGFVDTAELTIRVKTPESPGLAAQLDGTNVLLLLSGTMGQAYRVDYQSALSAASAWQVLTDITALALSPLPISDPATNGQRFYRAVSR
jgi:hypothetical protein